MPRSKLCRRWVTSTAPVCAGLNVHSASFLLLLYFSSLSESMGPSALFQRINPHCVCDRPRPIRTLEHRVSIAPHFSGRVCPPPRLPSGSPAASTRACTPPLALGLVPRPPVGLRPLVTPPACSTLTERPDPGVNAACVRGVELTTPGVSN